MFPNRLAGAQAPPQDPVRQRAPKVAVRALHVERGVQQGGEGDPGFFESSDVRLWREIQIQMQWRRVDSRMKLLAI